MHEVGAHPDRRGLGIERQPDAFAFEILRRADAAGGQEFDVAELSASEFISLMGISRPDFSVMQLRLNPAGTTSPSRIASIRS